MSDGEQEEEFTMELPIIWQFVHPEYARRGSTAGEEAEEESENDEENDEVARKKRAPKLGKLLRFLNDVEDEEELERMLQERDPVTQQTLIQWATRQQHFLLAEYLVKKAKRAAFGFPLESTEMAIYAKWEEMRPELPTPAELQARQQERDQKRAERLAAKHQRMNKKGAGNDNDEDDDDDDNNEKEDEDEDGDEEDDEDEDEEDEENEPLPEELVYEALSEYHDEWGERGAGLVKQIGELGVYLGARLKDGTKHGLGQALFPNGDIYTGEYHSNQRHGFGLYWWATQGVLYCGNWYHGVRHGRGRIVYPDGSRYLGGWARDVKHGTGHYIYSDGSSYDGAWVLNKRHGYGVYRFPDGASFHGSFVDGEFVTGEWRLASGTVRYVGNFIKDAPVGAGVYLHRLGSTSHGAFLQEGYYYKGEWNPGVLHGTTRVPPRLEVLAPQQKEPKRVPVTFAPECNGGTMADLVKAVNFPPVQQWLASLVPVTENNNNNNNSSIHNSGESGVVVHSMEICSVKYDPDDINLVVEVRLRPILHDASGKRLRLSITGDETIILKERTTRLLIIVERPGKDEVEREPMAILERSVQLPCAGKDHMQLRLPTIQVSHDGEIEGTFARAVQPALRITLNLHTTKQLLRPLRSNPLLGNAEEDVLMYVQQWHPEAHAALTEKLQVASAKPPPNSSSPSTLQEKPTSPTTNTNSSNNNIETEGCSYVAVPLSTVPQRSSDSISVIAATVVLQRRRLSELPTATVEPQRPPTPLPPAPEPRPELQPLYNARAAMQLAEAAGDEEEEEGGGS